MEKLTPALPFQFIKTLVTNVPSLSLWLSFRERRACALAEKIQRKVRPEKLPAVTYIHTKALKAIFPGRPKSNPKSHCYCRIIPSYYRILVFSRSRIPAFLHSCILAFLRSRTLVLPYPRITVPLHFCVFVLSYYRIFAFSYSRTLVPSHSLTIPEFS